MWPSLAIPIQSMQFIDQKKSPNYYGIITFIYIFELVCGLPVMTGRHWNTFSGFPFYFTDRYFHVLGDRVSYFQNLTKMYFITMSFLYVIQSCRRHQYEIRVPAGRMNKQPWRDRILPDLFLCVFLVSTMIPLLFSGNAKMIWTGAGGRYQGLKMWLFYAAAYLMIRHTVSEKSIRLCIRFMLLGGGISAVWGIADFAGIDPMGWIAAIKESQRGMFVSSYGNINTYTAAMTLFMAIAGVLSVQNRTADKDYKRIFKLVYRTLFFLFCIAMITGLSDNAAIGILAFFAITAFICRDITEILALFRLVQILLLAEATLFCYVNLFSGPVSPYINIQSGILLALALKKEIFQCCICIIVWLEMVRQILHRMRTQEKRVLRLWRGLLIGTTICCGLCAIEILILANTGHVASEAIQKYTRFNDQWGTWRGFVWRIAAEEYANLPIWQKLFGTGLETFGIVMKSTRYDEMLSVAGQVFDSPHNEILQYLFTSGMIGCFSLYAWYILTCIYAIRSQDKSAVCAVAVLVYICVSFVNISVPMTQVYIIVLVALMGQKSARPISDLKVP